MANRPELNATSNHLAKARWLVGEMQKMGGLAPVDLERFWADNESANRDPFGPANPQCAMGVWMTGECVYAELGIAEDYWRYEQDEAWRLSLNKAYNDKAEKMVGRRILNERPSDPAARWPATKGLHDIFEAKNVWDNGSWWLQQAAHDEDELRALLDRVDERLANLRAFVLPDNWESQKARLRKAGVPSPLYRAQRGPCTFATSVYGPENTLMLCLDNPGLAERFRDAIMRAMLGLGAVLDAERGWTVENSRNGDGRGFAFSDDNCCLFNPELYEFFGYPILKAIFERYAPDAGDPRCQHSDSAMGHLLPLLERLKLTRTNFGPTVSVAEIRRELPGAEIDGQLGPYTFSNNEHERIVLEFLRDFEESRESRGLRFMTAGSINNGSSLQSYRLILSAVQHFGRFDDRK